MNCLIVGGFLGAGKTTFLNSVLKLIEEKYSSLSIAILVNEFGEIPVDDMLIEKGNYSLAEITGGCVCCTLKGKLKDAVEEIRNNEAPDILIVEATGLAVPSEIAADIKSAGGMYVQTLLCIDPVQFDKLQGKITIYDRQLAEADFVLVTKQLIRDRKLFDNVLIRCIELFTAEICFTHPAELAGLILDREGNWDVSLNHAVNGDSLSIAGKEYHRMENYHMEHHADCDLADFNQQTILLAGKTDLTELEVKLYSISKQAGSELYRIKGIVETDKGWMTLQFTDEGMKTRPLTENKNRESFIVFIGSSEFIRKKFLLLWGKYKI